MSSANISGSDQIWLGYSISYAISYCRIAREQRAKPSTSLSHFPPPLLLTTMTMTQPSLSGHIIYCYYIEGHLLKSNEDIDVTQFTSVKAILVLYIMLKHFRSCPHLLRFH